MARIRVHNAGVKCLTDPSHYVRKSHGQIGCNVIRLAMLLPCHLLCVWNRSKWALLPRSVLLLSFDCTMQKLRKLSSLMGNCARQDNHVADQSMIPTTRPRPSKTATSQVRSKLHSQSSNCMLDLKPVLSPFHRSAQDDMLTIFLAISVSSEPLGYNVNAELWI